LYAVWPALASGAERVLTHRPIYQAVDQSSAAPRAPASLLAQATWTDCGPPVRFFRPEQWDARDRQKRQPVAAVVCILAADDLPL